MFPKSIEAFMLAEQVATVCCVEANIPYCFNCFYVLEEAELWLIYKSSGGAHHDLVLASNKTVAGTIIPKELAVASIQGIQFEAKLLNNNEEINAKALTCYNNRFPFSKNMPGNVHVLELQKIKFTDNTKGFGHKELWQREL